MKIESPNTENWFDTNVVHHIAKCARVCYASEVNNSSADKHLYLSLWKNGHRSMFRHAGVYYTIPEKIQISPKAYIGATVVQEGTMYYVSANEQSAKEYWDKRYYKYRVDYYNAFKIHPFIKHKLIRYTFCINTGIDITREYNRKSPNAIAEQSTRYVDFNKRVGIKFKKCHWMSKCNLYRKFLYKFMLKTTELFYKISRSKFGLNLKPEDARFILPLDTMSKVVYTYTVAEWEYIINMRLFDWTGKAHPDAKIIAKQIYDILTEKGWNIDNYNETRKYK